MAQGPHRGRLPRHGRGASLPRMSEPRLLRLYLEEGLRDSAAAGKHNFIGKIVSVVEAVGYRVEYRLNTAAERLKAPARRGYALFHMEGATGPRAMVFRRVYHYPFWAIEPSAKRWEWHVAQSAFPEDDVPRRAADRFFAFWQDRLFGEAAATARREGFVYVPLQGKLLTHRSFQTMSPLDMLRAVLAHDARPVVAALHPKEQYSHPELAALHELAVQSPRLSIQTGGMEAALAGCDYVATQNSSAAFNGYFFGKPAVLFGRIDFHHIAANVADLGAERALAEAPGMRPDYAGYLHWFWQRMSINAGRPEADAQIAAAFRRAGWPV